MAKKVYIDVIVDDKGTTKRVAVNAKALGDGLERAGVSAHSADRQLKGVAQTVNSSGKTFSKMSQGITGGLVPAYATLAANVFAITAAFQFFREASDFKVLQETQVSFAQTTGNAMKTVTGRLREAAGGMLKFKEAAQAAAMGAAKGFSASQLESLTIGARKASQALGRSFEDSFDRLIRGASKAEPELLDELGITLKLADATKKYGEVIGKNAKDLTSFERSQAVLLETQRQLDEQYGAIELKDNPFVKLETTFDDLIKTITQSVLPIFETLANFISKNAMVAALAFGAVAFSVLKSIPGVQQLGEKMSDLGKGSPLKKTVEEFKNYRKSIKDTRESLEKLKEAQAKKFSGIAGQMVKSGSSSKILAKVDKGGALNKADKANLRKALKSAEKQYKKHGKIVTGIFKGEDIKRVRHLGDAFEEMQRTSLKTTSRIKNAFKTTFKGIKVGAAGLKSGFKGLFRGIGKGAAFAGKAMGKMMKATIILGALQAIIRVFDQLMSAPASLLKAVITGMGKLVEVFQFVANLAYDVFAPVIDFFLGGIQNVLNGFVNMINSALETGWGKKLGEMMGIKEPIQLFTFADDVKEQEGFKFAEGITEKLTNITNDILANFGTSLEKLQETEDEASRVELLKEKLVDLGEQYTTLGTEVGVLVTGLNEQEDAGKRAIAAFTAITSTDVAGMLRQAFAFDKQRANKEGLLPEGVGSAVDELRRKLTGLSGIVPGLQKAFDKAASTGDFSLLDAIITHATNAKGSLKSLEDRLPELSTKLSEGGATSEVFMKELLDLAQASDGSAEALEQQEQAVALLNKAMGELGNAQEYYNKIVERREKGWKLDREKGELDAIAARKSFFPVLQAHNDRELKLNRANLAVEKARLAVQVAQDALAIAIETPTQTDDLPALKEARDAADALTTAKAVAAQAKIDFTIMGRMGQAAGNALSSSMQAAFKGIIDGTMKVKDAFRSMANAVIEAIQRIIAEWMAAQAIKGIMSLMSGMFGGGAGVGGPGTPNADFFSETPGFSPNMTAAMKPRYGGIFEPYATGGIARGRQAGYPVTLHGTEAVVPLPNNKEIPVQLQGGSQNMNNNNVAVNIDMGSGQSSSQGNEQQISQFGSIIADVVQREIADHTRPGGILAR